jgi:uncharacterized protein (TIGR00369 family)
MKVGEDNLCIVCGKDNPIGIHAKFDLNREELTSRAIITLDKNFQGWKGMAHGGVISALLDETMVYAAMAAEKPCVTAELCVRFKRPVPTEKELTLTGSVTELGDKLLRATANLHIDGKLHATATSRLFAVDQT